MGIRATVSPYQQAKPQDNLIDSCVLFSSICPGRYMASSAVWMAVATLLAAFDFAQFEDGSPDLNHPYMPGGLRYVMVSVLMWENFYEQPLQCAKAIQMQDSATFA